MLIIYIYFVIGTSNSKAIFELFAVHELRLVFPDLMIIGNSWKFFFCITHNLFCNKLLNCSLNWNIFALRGRKMTAH